MKAPSDETLARYVAGTASREEAARVEHYLEHDPEGFVQLERMRADDGLMNNLRQVLSADANTVASANAVTVASGNRGDAGSSAPTVLDVRVEGSAGSSWSAPIGTGQRQAHIEGYEILEELGRGGMGVVYAARQHSTKRKVALKVLLEGPFASSAAKRRFEREVELAARLTHPNVVTILESGIASGRYYFAMQYVEGQTLDKYFKRNEVTREQALTIFVHICRAISYAHQRGIIHRDLKPSNIIVDAEGEPHVLDFGLAKPADTYADNLEHSKALSLTGQLMGTLPYMSPEQASGKNQQVDIRTDIYSLGVMLYEALTGEFPYQVVGHVAEVLRNILEVMPRRPSTVQRQINNELETIVLKALSKEPERRYQSAEGLASDLEAYLSGAPIEAKRASNLYLARKLIQRNRGPVMATLMILVILAGSGWAVVHNRAQLAVAQAEQMLASFSQSPTDALRAFSTAQASIQNLVRAGAGRAMASAAAPQRVIGAAGGLWVAPDEFWKSVDGGPLWENGEWLEVCGQPDAATPEKLAAIAHVARTGSPRQRYVAWCVLGTLAHDADYAAQAATAAQQEPHSGVAAAAHWAARQLGAQVATQASDAVFQDEITGSAFVRIEGREDFKRGSPPTDADRFDDEDPPATGVAIPDLFVAQTEVTWGAWQKFIAAQEEPAVFDGELQSAMGTVLESVEKDEREQAATGYITLSAAQKYCDWLNAEAAKSDKPRRYRLPSEDEWEYLCRGASAKRFCYGDDPRYAEYFANCNGTAPKWHVVARHMPNWYGLFDMHGGLWEWTTTKHVEQGQELNVYRGGAFYSPAVRCRSAQRNYGSPDVADSYRGLRLVMEFTP